MSHSTSTTEHIIPTESLTTTLYILTLNPTTLPTSPSSYPTPSAVESDISCSEEDNSTKLRLPMTTPSNPVDTQQAFPTTNTDKMIDQVETASVTLSGIRQNLP